MYELTRLRTAEDVRDAVVRVSSDTRGFRRWVVIGEFRPDVLTEDCLPVEVSCLATPARFYRLATASGALTTGSGAEDLVAVIGQAFADGMLGFAK